MNRKERRKADKTAPARPLSAIFGDGDRAHRAGDLAGAERAYRAVLHEDPRHADSLHRLGLIAHQRGEQAQAVALLRRAILLQPDRAAYHSHLALALQAMGQVVEAIASCRTAIALDPAMPDSPNTLGLLLMQQGAVRDAVAAFRQSIARNPSLAEVHNNLGTAQLALGCIREAAQSYRDALALAPDFVDARANLALTLHAIGDHGAAVRESLNVLRAGETVESRRVFIACIKDARLGADGDDLKPLLAKALQGWGRPEELAACAAGLVMADKAAWDALPDEDFLARLAGDRLLLALLQATPNLDLALEHLLTRARHILLQSRRPDMLPLRSAMARQCFLKEYVFDCAPTELEQVAALGETLAQDIEAGRAPDAALLLALASYQPLYTVPEASRLLALRWPPDIHAVLVQQIAEPQAERDLKTGIARLTPITDAVSCAVKDQYEANPYPRWTEIEAVGDAQPLSDYVRHQFPLAPLQPHSPGADILVVGCGTGRNAIETSLVIRDANVLAIDLSLSSLAHAVRKAGCDFPRITFAQADLMALDGHRFDLIEATGVLHHMADPFAGWRHLLSLLKPGGFMNLGLYSRAGRQDIAAARGFLSEKGLGDGAEGLRAARRALIASGAFDTITERQDFYTISACRDLLCHVQEHQLDLKQVAEFLRQNNLRLLGFWIEPSILMSYRSCYPDDPAALDLDKWAAFEADNPQAFAGMYRFWVQKDAA